MVLTLGGPGESYEISQSMVDAIGGWEAVKDYIHNYEKKHGIGCTMADPDFTLEEIEIAKEIIK